VPETGGETAGVGNVEKKSKPDMNKDIIGCNPASVNDF
jgi:hypothetical protein